MFFLAYVWLILMVNVGECTTDGSLAILYLWGLWWQYAAQALTRLRPTFFEHHKSLYLH